MPVYPYTIRGDFYYPNQASAPSRLDPVSFAREKLHFLPDPIQEQLLLTDSRQVI